MRIRQRRWELRRSQNARANLLDEVDMRQEGAAWIGVRIEYANPLVKLLAHDSYGLEKV